MIEFWLPDPVGNTYRQAAADALDRVDVVCGPCGTVRPRLVAHFVRPAGVDTVGVLPFAAEGAKQGPAFWMKRGVLRFRTLCPSGHDANIERSAVARLLEAKMTRVSLWPDGRITV